jgi:streptogramin lyase
MKVRTFRLNDAKFSNWKEIENRWNYEDFIRDKTWRTKWTSFDCCHYVCETGLLYLGVTSFNGDIFTCFDRKTESFFDCGYSRIRAPYDAKFHRSLEYWEKDRCIYGAVALLHDIDHYWDAPGGAIVRFDPASGDIAKLCIPMPHNYIQTIRLDQKTGVIYGLTLIPERLFAFDIASHHITDIGPVGSCGAFAQGENIEIDGLGRVWFGWNVLRAWQPSPGPDSNRLARYDPGERKIVYFNNGLETQDGSYGFVKVEGLFNLAGKMFASGGNGSIYKIDVETGHGKYLGTPISSQRSRLASLRMGPDGYAYGVAGRDGACHLLRFDPRTEQYEILGPVESNGEKCWQVHDIAVTPDGVVFACENDNPERSGYLWEITL